jgi:hypothetical protein
VIRLRAGQSRKRGSASGGDIRPLIQASIPDLRPTQPRIQRTADIIHGVKLPAREANHSPPNSVEVKKSRAISPPFRWYSTVRTSTLILHLNKEQSTD